jgi:hypothetical protein
LKGSNKKPSRHSEHRHIILEHDTILAFEKAYKSVKTSTKITEDYCGWNGKRNFLLFCDQKKKKKKKLLEEPSAKIFSLPAHMKSMSVILTIRHPY